MDISQFELQANIEDIHWWFKARREIIFNQLRKFIPPDRGKRIAEIGCGTGGNLKFLSQHYQMVGVDISPEAVSYAKERVNCKVFHGDFRDALTGMWEDLDGVILSDVLEHIVDHEAFLRDLAASIKAEAVLLITVPAHQWLWSRHDLILGHKRRYTVQGLRSLWKDLPVTELLFSPFNCLLFPVIVLYRKLVSHADTSDASDLRLPSSFLNGLLYRIFSSERHFLRRCSLPWGLSYLAMLKKYDSQ